MKLNKKCMVCGEELWVMNDEVEFSTYRAICGVFGGTGKETLECKCMSCQTEYTIKGEYESINKLKDRV